MDSDFQLNTTNTPNICTHGGGGSSLFPSVKMIHTEDHSSFLISSPLTVLAVGGNEDQGLEKGKATTARCQQCFSNLTHLH